MALEVGLLCAGLSAAACSSGTSGSTATHTSRSGRTEPGGSRTIGGTQAGLSLAVPRAWVSVDLSSSDATLNDFLHAYDSDSGSTDELVRAVREQHYIYAVDPMTKGSSVPTNVTAHCENVAQGSDAQMSTKMESQLQAIGSTNVPVRDTTVNGRPAIVGTYLQQVQAPANSKTTSAITTGRQYRIATAPGRMCYVTMIGRQDADTPWDQIGPTIRLTG
jgi:hypothetical protein